MEQRLHMTFFYMKGAHLAGSSDELNKPTL